MAVIFIKSTFPRYEMEWKIIVKLPQRSGLKAYTPCCIPDQAKQKCFQMLPLLFVNLDPPDILGKRRRVGNWESVEFCGISESVPIKRSGGKEEPFMYPPSLAFSIILAMVPVWGSWVGNTEGPGHDAAFCSPPHSYMPQLYTIPSPCLCSPDNSDRLMKPSVSWKSESSQSPGEHLHQQSDILPWGLYVPPAI